MTLINLSCTSIQKKQVLIAARNPPINGNNSKMKLMGLKMSNIPKLIISHPNNLITEVAMSF